jgi:hypothetical protein
VFVEPKTKKSGDRSKFFEMNTLAYNPVQETDTMIRVVKDGSMPSQLARKEEIKRVQH